MQIASPDVTETGWRLAELAQRTGTTLDGDGALRITRVASLESAGPGAITFIVNRRHEAKLMGARASAVIVSPDMSALTTLPKLVSGDPYATFARIAALLHPAARVEPGVHPAATIGVDARVATSATVGAHASIGNGTIIGERAKIGTGCAVGANVRIGDDALLHANVTIYDHCFIGARTILHSGAVIGADGFGLAEESGRWLKIPQLGRVVIGDDVEIGANTTIDRGALDDTVIEDDVKLDNQIQIGHNCHIGAHTAIAGCVGIAGSVRIGRNCKIGGAAMIAGHLHIPDGTVISAATVVPSSIATRGIYTGVFPITGHATWRRIAAELRHLVGYTKRLRALERRMGLASADADKERNGEAR